jgi:pimeloyl-ACP methyl ester carboxylesterase
MMAKITTSVNLEPIDLVGFSMGGYVALQYALTYPQAIKRLIIIAATGTGLTEQEQRRRHHILRYMKTNPYNGIPTQRLKQFIHPDNINSPAADTIRQMDKSLGKETLVAQLQATAQRPSLLSQLHTLKCPVLVVGAHQDKLVQPQEIETLGSHFSCATIKFINQGGHMTPLEAPQQLATMINGFLLDDN